ncbi:hypothetical protein [Umboniibacter marinipuniceus]|uniref:Uncharacterized protein n=1 Tax=Umboniibacter marinipuniceus TaxID=569599 RepID=A0A3M0A8R8_9GAMM|nr:hypothetical protein [Umboniibacter marinipuniceus]RMA81006.1 hypothetical protein DFR27_0796 [Umboniibacter marinipuniceus]
MSHLARLIAIVGTIACFIYVPVSALGIESYYFIWESQAGVHAYEHINWERLALQLVVVYVLALVLANAKKLFGK